MYVVTANKKQVEILACRSRVRPFLCVLLKVEQSEGLQALCLVAERIAGTGFYSCHVCYSLIGLPVRRRISQGFG